MYLRFGSEVTIIEMGSRLIGREDEDVFQAVREILEREGIQIRVNAKCISLTKRNSHIAVGLDCKEGPPEVLGTHVLLAVGCTPNTHDLGLDRAGVTTDQRGYIVVDDQLQTNVPGIWAWVTATAAAPLRIPLTTTMKSSRTIFSTQTIAACQTEFRHMPST